MTPDHSVYRNLKPEFDLNLCQGEMCHIAEVIVKTDKPKAGETRVSISNDLKTWTQILKAGAKEDDVLKFIVPGEQYAKFLKISFPRNTNGGGFVSTRQIIVRGIKKSLIAPH